jgi:large subunit ribosomal protein L25
LEILNLKASPRERVGNGPARVLRREGQVPAILYGPNTEPVKLTIDKADLEPIFKSGAVAQKLLTLNVDGAGKGRNVMIKALQRHPVSHTLLHLDLYEVSMDQKIKVMVPVVTSGQSVGVEMGGMLQIIRRELEVFCRPDQIPENITIDITDMDVGDSFHVDDLQLEENIDVPAEVNFTILTILSTKGPAAEEEEGEEGEGEGVEGVEAAEESAGE